MKLPIAIKNVFIAKFIRKTSSDILARKYIPRSLSKEAGKNAVTGVGASSAVSGTQVWNGIAPALANAPIARQRYASPATFVLSGMLKALISSVWAMRQISANPKSMTASEPPIIIKAFFAVDEVFSFWPKQIKR